MTAPGARQSRGRIAVLAALALVVGAGWIHLLHGAGMAMEPMDMGGGQMMPMMPAWTPSYAALVFQMWVVMMGAMMLPTAAPVLLQIVDRSSRPLGPALPGPLFFALAYLAVWIGFSLIATAAQWAFDAQDWLSEAMALRSSMAARLLIIAVGLYQLLPVKHACLRRCRVALGSEKQDAARMAKLGVRYGVACLGCCAVLMALLFVSGVMSVLWMALITLLVLAEKALPQGERLARLTGFALIAWGAGSLTLAA